LPRGKGFFAIPPVSFSGRKKQTNYGDALSNLSFYQLHIMQYLRKKGVDSEMANTVLSYNAVTVTPVTDGVQIPVPLTPGGVGLAAVRVSVPIAFPNTVELKATVGIRGDTGTGSVLFRIFRDDQVIYYARQGVESGFEKYYLATLQALDITAPVGSHGYTLSIESLTPGLVVTVIGPITLSATVIDAQ
jgi:hypothetical protein